MPELVDCHTHTCFSDGTGTFLENVQAALAAGCTTMACTDHLTLPTRMDPDCECSVAETDLTAHRLAFEEVREACPTIELVYGFEADWYEGCEPNIAAWRGAASFVLGSVHFIDGLSVDYEKEMDLWIEWGPDEMWRQYVDRWCKACFSAAKFDSMAHPDLVSIFSRSGYAPTIDLAPLWDAMAEAAKESGVHVELSTAGLRKPVQDYYPSSGLLACFQRAGVPLTVGSDAHTPETVCWGIENAYKHAYDHGFRSIDVPTADGEWRRMAL